ncbi:transcription factor HES-2-like isoform X1 [Paroedura picta]|uniref:transcription factor HES-2-like isoform X1 n=1 Tax=Paroedura picta TaxID=143630 RepID=UPI0040565BC3
MDLQRVQSEALLTETQALKRHSGWKPQLEQPKHLVYKKLIKPLMERRRRERIARCLGQLKMLLVDAPDQDHKHLPNSRMDKAALLEMTVQRIQTLQLAVAEDKAYHTGYSYCASPSRAFLISETRQQPEPLHPSASVSPHETTPLASLKSEVLSHRTGNPAGLKCFVRSDPPSTPNTAGPLLFWRPWST